MKLDSNTLRQRENHVAGLRTNAAPEVRQRKRSRFSRKAPRFLVAGYLPKTQTSAMRRKGLVMLGGNDQGGVAVHA